MDYDFIILIIILAIIGAAGIFVGFTYHPIMYVNSAVIFGFLGYFGWQMLRDGRAGKRETSRY